MKVFSTKNKQFIQPYSEIINLDDELNEYKRLCKGEKEKYTYTNWKNDIIDKISLLDTEEKKINFERYLINQKRVLSNINYSFLPIMICFITVMLSNISWILPDGYIFNCIKFVVIISALLWCIRELATNQNNNNYEYCFYCDLIEIVEEMIQK